jgi:hypothetical protein
MKPTKFVTVKKDWIDGGILAFIAALNAWSRLLAVTKSRLLLLYLRKFHEFIGLNVFRGKKWRKKKKTIEQLVYIRSQASKKGWRTRKLMAAARNKA